jgi:glycosyltransferase involved in cell wall biosynthesis
MKNKSIWIDITDLSTWSGHFTGTQRVTYEVAKGYSKSNYDVHYFIYNEKSRHFYEATLDVVEDNIAVDDNKITVNAAERRTMKSKLRSNIFHIYHTLPKRVRDRVTDEHKQKIKNLYIKLNNKRLVIKKAKKTKNFQSNNIPLLFDVDCIVVILGKPWDTMTFIEDLKIQRINTSFKIVNLIYDMIPIYMPHLFGYPLPKNYIKYMFDAISISDRVMAISKNTKNDVITFCNDQQLPCPEIDIIKLGVNNIGMKPSKIPSMFSLNSGEYILCVSTIEIRKNHQILYNAYREAVKNNILLPKLVICGGKGWYTGDIIHEFNNDPLINDVVKIIESPNDEELLWLYDNCIYSIYPSVYEGWGLPIAESLSRGKLCISSDTSSMPEVAGDLVDYFSPYDSRGCMNLIIKYAQKDNRKLLEERIRKEYIPTSWDDTFKVFEKSLNKIT